MPPDDENQHSRPSADVQSESHTSDAGATTQEAAHAPSQSSSGGSQNANSPNSGIIADSFGIWLRMFGKPIEPEFKDDKVTPDNPTLLKLLIFAVVVSS